MEETLKKVLAIIGLGASKATGGATAGTEVMQQSPDLLLATQKNYQYNRNTYRTLVRFSLIEAATVIFLILVAGWIIVTANPQDRFFLATVDGRITRVIPLDTPTANNQQMYVSIGTGIALSLTFGSLDFEQRKTEVASLFTPEALTAFYGKFFAGGAMEAMRQNNHVYITAVEPTRPGGVLSQGVNENNTYQWVIQVPLLVTRKNGTSEEGQVLSRWVAVVLVERARAIEITRGFLVTNLLDLRLEGIVQQAASQIQGVTP